MNTERNVLKKHLEYNTKPINCDCKCALCIFDEDYYGIRNGMNKHNIYNQQTTNNITNVLYNVIDTLKSEYKHMYYNK